MPANNFAGGTVFLRSLLSCGELRRRSDMKRCPSIFAAATLLAAITLLAALTRAVPVTHANPVAHDRTGIAPARAFAPRQLLVKFAGEPRGRVVPLPPHVGVRNAAAVLRGNPSIAYAAPNYTASASARQSGAEAAIPNDPGSLDPTLGTPGGWIQKQWNFLPWEGEGTPVHPTSPGGIDAIGAWENLIAAGRPGAAGITVAVLDTGIAYRAHGSNFLRSPDFMPEQFVKGYDFIDHNRLPLDKSGHGTHVAGTIAEKTDNGIGLTGLAYNAKLMPVRVLNRYGVGNAHAIAQGIHYAVVHGADVINMSFNFDCHEHVPTVNEELRRAYRAGVVTVASIGNAGSETCIAAPATGPHVIGVAGSTEGGCLGKYSLSGKRIDVTAPGGGHPTADCPSVLSRSIFQVTLNADTTTEFAEPTGYIGTSMAAAHVSGVAAMILASGVVSPTLSPSQRVTRVVERLRNTARSLGLSPREQGAGLIDAARATEPTVGMTRSASR
jgi:serine protease